MNKQDAKKRIEKLRKQAEYHAKRYYDDDNPEPESCSYPHNSHTDALQSLLLKGNPYP